MIGIAAAINAQAADGDLDASFDGDGKVTTDFGTSSEQINDAVQQPDGKSSSPEILPLIKTSLGKASRDSTVQPSSI